MFKIVRTLIHSTDFINIKSLLAFIFYFIFRKNHILNHGSCLKGEELDAALLEATKDCPDLLQLINSDYWNSNQSQVDYNKEKELYDADCKYLQSIENSIKTLR